METNYTLYANKVNLNPVITTQPKELTAEKGSAIPLSVEAEAPAEGILSYQWYKGTNSITGKKIIGATEAEYLPPSVRHIIGRCNKKIIVQKSINMP